MTVRLSRKRRWLAPDVVQTSEMDCGPAVLKGLLEGFGIRVQLGRLREACQTDVDGTSIDVLEEVARQVGLDAEQEMLPVDHLLLPEAEALPAIVVVRQPAGLTHFVLVWRRHGALVQVLDPAVGRRWMTGRQLLDEIYVHRQRVPADAWQEWARSEGMLGPLRRRLQELGLGRAGRELLDTAAAEPDWRCLAALDAAVRLVQSLVRARAVRRGRQTQRLLAALLAPAEAAGASPGAVIPEPFWSVRPEEPSADGQEQVALQGAVLVRVRGRWPPRPGQDVRQAFQPDHPASEIGISGGQPGKADVPGVGVPDLPSRAELSPELASALAEPSSRPGRELLRAISGAGWFSFLALAVGLLLASGFAVLEALLLRGVIDIGHDLALVEQRLQAAGLLLALGCGLLLLDFRISRQLFRLGRRLEAALRVRFLQKIPRLNDRYFHSRPISDMTERSHALQQLHLLPQLAGQFLRSTLTLLITAGAIAWVDPASVPLAILAAVLALVLPCAFLPVLQSLDLRLRTHGGALSRFYLDALLGLSAVRAHGAQRAVRREHEGLLVEWTRSHRQLLQSIVLIEGLQLLCGLGLAGGLVMLHAGATSDAAGLLLVGYWALNLPVLGQEIALLARQYPLHRSTVLRLLEPLGAPEPERSRGVGFQPAMPHSGSSRQAGSLPHGQQPDRGAPPTPCQQDAVSGVAIHFDEVSVRAAGQTILDRLNVAIPAGSHVAIVGPSGAGKSSLVGVLLGWHRPASGRVLIDGRPLDAARLDRLRDETAWVDPAIQIWNRSVFDNILFGAPGAGPRVVGELLAQADLYGIVQRLPEGLQTPLGEGGGLLSGGEGQRVRLSRAMARSAARLVILDEPCRGLDRGQRGRLLNRARQLWPQATLLCITHDVGETLAFPRVLVIDHGQVVEDASPQSLLADPQSLYRALFQAEQSVRSGLWADPQWRRLQLEQGQLHDARQAPASGGSA